jgi:hypothetical protein
MQQKVKYWAVCRTEIKNQTHSYFKPELELTKDLDPLRVGVERHQDLKNNTIARNDG